MTAATIINKFLSLILQAVLGYLLIDDDFGAWAAALGLATLLTTTRELATTDLLIKEGRAKGIEYIRSCFTIGFLWNTICGLSLVAAYPLVANAYQPITATIVALAGVWLIFSTPASFMLAALVMDMRFRRRAEIDVAAMFTRAVATATFAMLGAGALSFILAWFVVSLVETVAVLLSTRERYWKPANTKIHYRGILKNSKWLVTARASGGLFNFGDYLVAGYLLTYSTVGLYFFAFNLIAQTGVLFAANLQTALLPSLSRIGDEPMRFAAAIYRALRIQSLITAPAFGLIAVVIDPITRSIWLDKWAAAIPAMQALALLYPLRMTVGVTPAALKARGAFKTEALLTLAEGFAVMAAAAVASIYFGTVLSLTLAVGAIVPVTRFIICAIAVGPSPGRWKKLAITLLPPWFLCSAIAIAVIAIHNNYPAEPDRLSQAVRLIILAASYTLITTIAIRLTEKSRLTELLSLFPNKLRSPAQAALLLPRNPATKNNQDKPPPA